MTSKVEQQSPHHVVIVGGGFGGLHAALSLGDAPVKVTLIDKRNFHLFQPLLYQVATGGLSPAEISSPLRSILNKQQNTTVLMGEVQDVDPQQQKIFRLAILSLFRLLPQHPTKIYLSKTDTK